MFTAVLFTIVKTWKQPVSNNRWTDKDDVMYIYKGILFSHRNNEIMPFGATGMDLVIITLSQTETNIIGYHLYEESKKWYKWTHL